MIFSEFHNLPLCIHLIRCHRSALCISSEFQQSINSPFVSLWCFLKPQKKKSPSPPRCPSAALPVADEANTLVCMQCCFQNPKHQSVRSVKVIALKYHSHGNCFFGFWPVGEQQLALESKEMSPCWWQNPGWGSSTSEAMNRKATEPEGTRQDGGAQGKIHQV